MRSTYTYAVLDISQTAYEEIATKLKAAGYDHAFHDSGNGEVIDMHGIAVAALPAEPVKKCNCQKSVEELLEEMRKWKLTPEELAEIDGSKDCKKINPIDEDSVIEHDHWGWTANHE